MLSVLPSVRACRHLAASLWLVATLSHLQAADPGKLTITPDHPQALYTSGETTTWTIAGQPAAELSYEIRRDGQDVLASGKLDLSSGSAQVSAAKTEPGTLVLKIFETGKADKPIAWGGTLYDWSKIQPSLPAPADFDAFWSAQLAKLAQVPPNPVVVPGDLPPNTQNIEYFKVTLDNINGTHVYGQLARPKDGTKFPAMLILQFAGVYPLKKTDVALPAMRGWLALNISAHDLPIDEAPEFYEEQKKGPLKDYIYIGAEDREASYFLRMFLGCVRAAQYLTSRTDWDGKTLLVTGASQGGLQSLATAALVPQTSTLAICVPAGCDILAPLATPARAFGWPYLYSNWGGKRDLEKVKTTAPYFDGAHFAARIKCPSLIGVGLLDQTSRPTAVLAAFNAIQAPKDILIMPAADHHGTAGSQQLYFKRATDWQTALSSGKPLPIPQDSIEVDTR